MFTRVLVPLDGSDFAEAALSAAFSLAPKKNGEVRFIYVLEPIPEDLVDTASAERYLARATEKAAQKWGGTVSTSLRAGLAAHSIVAEAEEWGADVIVMATHGRGGASRTWMGSVTDRCIRRATCPVLAVHPDESGASKPLATSQIVVPLDGSPLAEAALPYAAALAKQLGVRVVLLKAVIVPPVVEPSYIPQTMDLGHDASIYLKGHVDWLRSEGVDATESVLVDRRAAHAILSCADGDLVVMSTHGRTGVERALLGSVADKVIRGTTGAVLVIPPQRSLTDASDEIVGVTVAFSGQ